MNHPSPSKSPPPPSFPSLSLSPHDWDLLLDDFSSHSPSRISFHSHLFPHLLPLSLHSLLLPSFPSYLKPHLLSLLSDHSSLLVPPSSLPSLLSVFPSLSDSPLKDLFLVSATSISISLFHDQHNLSPLQPLLHLLLTSLNRPNHSPDRTFRSLAAESLRQLEQSFPLLLSDLLPLLFSLAQSERTHASQSYLLLLAQVLSNVVAYNLIASPVSILSNSAPLVPFAVPQIMEEMSRFEGKVPTEQNLKEVRRVMAFLLEWPQGLTPPGTMELVRILVEIAGELERHIPAVAALLKVQFSGLIHSYHPVLVHVVVMLYARFPEAFVGGGDEVGVLRRLAVMPKDAGMMFVFRVLAVHWMLGVRRVGGGKEGLVDGLAGLLYPSVFDPLALKATKLEALACIALRLDGEGGEGEGRVVKLLEDGLVCVSGFKWLPPWSTETAVAFRTLHKFLIGVIPHCSGDNDKGRNGFAHLLGSTIFGTIKVQWLCLALLCRKMR